MARSRTSKHPPPIDTSMRVHEFRVGRETLTPGDYLRVARGPGGTFVARFRYVECDDFGNPRWVQVVKAQPGKPSSTHSIRPDRVKRLSKQERVRANDTVPDAEVA